MSNSWMADRYLVYEGPAPGQLALIARTRWQDAEAATAFCSDYRTILEKRSTEAANQANGKGEASAEATSGSAKRGSQEILFETSGTRRTFLFRQGNECRWAENVPAAQADAVAKWLEALP
jgi:hypothetical protein